MPNAIETGTQPACSSLATSAPARSVTNGRGGCTGPAPRTAVPSATNSRLSCPRCSTESRTPTMPSAPIACASVTIRASAVSYPRYRASTYGAKPAKRSSEPLVTEPLVTVPPPQPTPPAIPPPTDPGMPPDVPPRKPPPKMPGCHPAPGPYQPQPPKPAQPMCATTQPITSPIGGSPTPVTDTAPGTSSKEVRTPPAWNRAIRAAAAGGRPLPSHSAMTPDPSAASWMDQVKPWRPCPRSWWPGELVTRSAPGSAQGPPGIASLLVRLLGQVSLVAGAWRGYEQRGLLAEAGEELCVLRRRLRGRLLHAALVQRGTEDRPAQHDDAEDGEPGQQHEDDPERPVARVVVADRGREPDRRERTQCDQADGHGDGAGDQQPPAHRAAEQEVLRPPAPAEDDRCPEEKEQDGAPWVVQPRPRQDEQ